MPTLIKYTIITVLCQGIFSRFPGHFTYLFDGYPTTVL